MFQRIFLSLTAAGIAITTSSLSSREIQNNEPVHSINNTAKIDENKETKQNSFLPFTGKVNGSKVRLRLQANLDAHIIKELNKGNLLLVTDEENGFYSVMPSSDTKAYIFRSYVLDNVVEGNNVNVRLEPHRDGSIIAQLNTGDKAEGVISPVNSKWIEIPPPQSTRFYVAKEFIDMAGDPTLIGKMEQQRSEVHNLLNSSYLLAQTEMRKPFEEIDIERVSGMLENIIENYPDFSIYTEKAKEILDLIQETYLQKKVAFLETKVLKSSKNWTSKSNALSEQIASYENRLAELEKELNETQIPSSSQQQDHLSKNSEELQKPTETSSLSHNSLQKKEMIDNTSLYLKKDLPQEENVKNSNSLLEKQVLSSEEQLLLTDKMLIWEPIEQVRFRDWVIQNPAATNDDFYIEEKLYSIELTGIIEPYNRPVKNKPGDYILRKNNKTIAYLYSTKVDLQQKIGEEVILNGNLRPNNHFAFPAYHVLSVE